MHIVTLHGHLSSCRYGVWYSDDTVEVLPTCKPIVCNHPVIANGALETGESVRCVEYKIQTGPSDQRRGFKA